MKTDALNLDDYTLCSAELTNRAVERKLATQAERTGGHLLSTEQVENGLRLNSFPATASRSLFRQVARRQQARQRSTTEQ